MQHVPFRGAAPLKLELLAGRMHVGGDQLSTSMAEIKAGTRKALATTASTRVTSLPMVPTVRELGFPNLELEGWNGLFVPAKTPRKIVERLSREAAAAVKHPEVSRKLIEMGAEPVGSSAAAHDDIFKRQMNQFRPVIREIPYFPALAGHVKRSDLDFVQVHYSIQMRLAEDRILPAAMDKGTAVLVNMPFEKARLFSLVQGRPLPSFAKEIACENWAQYFLKWVISHPAITCVIPATSNPVHQAQNIGALRGPLPDKDLRSRMLKQMESIPGFDKLQETPPYPGKSYQGLIRRAINARTAVAR